MKKRITIALSALCILLMFSACKSQNVKNAEQAIDQIGEVSLSSQEVIESAEAAYSSLSEKEQSNVENYQTLTAAREQYDSMVAEANEEAAPVIEAISELGDINTYSGESLENARALYEALSDNGKQMVTNLDVLETKEQEYIDVQAQKIEAAIANIGTVKIGSKQTITTAREAYDAADETVQAAVTNYDVLTKAESEFFDLDVSYIEEQIDSIGEVTLDNTYVEAARKAYDSASEDIQNAISNYATLEEAEQKLSELKAANVVSLIDAIGEVSIYNEAAITTAEDAFDALTRSEREMVTNKDTLTQARSTYDAAKAENDQKLFAEAKNNCNIDEDKVTGTTYYYHKTFPEYINTRCYIQPVTAVQGNVKALFVRYNYKGSDWVFWDHLTINVDGVNYTKSFSYFNIVRDNNGGDVWEYYDDENVSLADVQMLDAIAQSSETIIRFEGDNYHYDYTVTDADKQAIHDEIIIWTLS